VRRPDALLATKKRWARARDATTVARTHIRNAFGRGKQNVA
jgi:hypothetical protein